MKTSILVLALTLLFAFSVFASEIVINEIMYNSTGSDVEFIELYNTTTAAVSLTGWSLLDDNASHKPCPLTGTIDAGGYFIIASNVATFQTKYPNAGPLNPADYDTGNDAWSFGNGGDVVSLYASGQVLHDQVAYDDGGDWPGSPDGNGPSLELLHPSLDNTLPTSWDPSVNDNGTPGEINSVYTTNVMPTCRDGERLIPLPSSSSNVTVQVIAFDNEGLEKVELMVSTGAGFIPLLMNDAGINGDAIAGDSVFTCQIPAQSNGTLVQYYAVATDNIGQTDLWPNKAPDEYHAYTVGYEPPDIRITELLAINSNINSDEAGEFDDWFEIYNASSSPVNLGGLFVSTAFGSSQMFELPNAVLQPGAYQLIWADDDESQGDFHTNFKLSGGGESIAIFETIDHGNVMIHGWKYGLMSEDVSMGLKPVNGSAPEYLATPTPGASNASSALFSDVCINEFQATSDFGGPDDWVEIYNRGNTAFDLSGCFLSDQRGNNTKWQFPVGAKSILQPGEYLLVYEDELEFGWSSAGDDVIMLTAADSTTGLDFYDFDVQVADQSEGRFPDGVGVWEKFDSPTQGAQNTNPAAVKDPSFVVPESITLHQNYPNPFNPSTTLSFSLAVRGHVSIKIFNAIGQEVALIADRLYQAGTYHVLWNAENMPSGPYWVEMRQGSEQQIRKMVLLK